MLYCSCYETARGVGGILANDVGLVAVLLPQAGGIAPHLAAMGLRVDELRPSPLSDAAAALLRSYFAGARVSCALPFDERSWTPFRRAVYRVTMAIPSGEVLSYGQVATMCGHPRAARAVGRIMATNPLPILIPCHRVVAGTGALTGYSAPGGVACKAELLQLEGVALASPTQVRR
jgi:methylated-DNA-[protein]-cysteine S-methyltransferase